MLRFCLGFGKRRIISLMTLVPYNRSGRRTAAGGAKGAVKAIKEDGRRQ